MYFPIIHISQKKTDFKIWNGCFSHFYAIYGNINHTPLIRNLKYATILTDQNIGIIQIQNRIYSLEIL